MNDFEQGSIDSYLNNESRINHWKRALYQAIKNNISIFGEIYKTIINDITCHLLINCSLHLYSLSARHSLLRYTGKCS